jgi:hypothetical protein
MMTSRTTFVLFVLAAAILVALGAAGDRLYFLPAVLFLVAAFATVKADRKLSNKPVKKKK